MDAVFQCGIFLRRVFGVVGRNADADHARQNKVLSAADSREYFLRLTFGRDSHRAGKPFVGGGKKNILNNTPHLGGIHVRTRYRLIDDAFVALVERQHDRGTGVLGVGMA